MRSHRHILIIDDDQAMRSMLGDFLRGEGHRVTEVRLASEALAKIESGEIPSDVRPEGGDIVDLAITDLSMPEMNGIDFVDRLHALAPHMPVILMTAFGSIETAIEAIRKGAFDYRTKPFKLSEMSVTVERALRFRRLHLENRRLQDELERGHSFARIIGKSPGMRDVFDLIRRVAPARANVLISGESGTGKERVARAIHDEGPRRTRNFVAINCTAIPETLLESELFGHAKGSFTGAANRKRGLFEEADGGTLFLDEIGDMDLQLQSKLLRVLQERKIRAVGDTHDREVDVRVIAATHKDLKQAIRNGAFREDLYYRLAVIPILIPPLRHRREDIPLLAGHFLKKYAQENHSSIVEFSKEALSMLLALPWEGNVRELENAVERAVVLARGKKIEAADLPSTANGDFESFLESAQAGALPTLEELEKRYIRFVLEKTGGKKEKTSQILGCNRRTLYRKVREYGLIGDESGSSEPDAADDEADDEGDDEADHKRREVKAVEAR